MEIIGDPANTVVIVRFPQTDYLVKLSRKYLQSCTDSKILDITAVIAIFCINANRTLTYDGVARIVIHSVDAHVQEHSIVFASKQDKIRMYNLIGCRLIEYLCEGCSDQHKIIYEKFKILIGLS